jgi:hypothetical protein
VRVLVTHQSLKLALKSGILPTGERERQGDSSDKKWLKTRRAAGVPLPFISPVLN